MLSWVRLGSPAIRFTKEYRDIHIYTYIQKYEGCIAAVLEYKNAKDALRQSLNTNLHGKDAFRQS